MSTFRWGILGTGAIAGLFAEGLESVEDAELAAVGSRTRASAERFGDAHAVPRRHASYAALAADPEVDAVYVSTPHVLHKENTLLCLAAGKPVLCEKPFAMNAREAEEMISAARERGTFLMEAMWTRWNPVTVKVRELLASGAIGEPRLLLADFGFRARRDPRGRLFDPALGGGALLDVGVYPVSYAHMVFGGPPDEVAGLAALGTTGVDEQSGYLLRWSDGRLAVLCSAVRTETPQEAVICGTEGRIRVPRFWNPRRLFLGDEEVGVPVEGNGYGYEAREVAACVRAGRRESAVLPLAETLAIVRTLDRLRAPWGIAYPGE